MIALVPFTCARILHIMIKTKHIDIKLHFIRNEVSKGAVKMSKVHTDENPADILTKVVPTAKFSMCLNLAGLSSH